MQTIVNKIANLDKLMDKLDESDIEQNDLTATK